MAKETINIENTVATSYLDYSMSVIVGRALPDVRDGLKPVHRRILYGMSNLNATPTSPFKKSARVVGDVIGKYHPHGDSAVYDALVRMAQPFSQLYPLVDGQGNFGSIDGDNAAASRYTEARMTHYAEEMLKDLDKQTTDFVPNYDDSTTEPTVLPTTIPNLLVNGSSGIAVGMSTNIPPHNLGEVMDALIQIVKHPNTKTDKLISMVKGPDFPTGGIIFGKEGIVKAYETGKGRIKIRAKTHFEQNEKGRDVIIIDEIPYQTVKAKIIEHISQLVNQKTLLGIAEIRDESDRNGMRMVIVLKRDADIHIVLNNLFKQTQLEKNFSISMLTIVNKEPRVLNLREILDYFVRHRKTVVIRRTIFELDKAKKRAHLLEGLLKAVSQIDKVIKIIKSSKNHADALETLMDKIKLTAEQAKAILDMQLKRLTNMEQEQLENELELLYVRIGRLEAILKDNEQLNAILIDEFREIRKRLNKERKTEIVDAYEEIDVSDLIPNEPMVVTVTHRGYIKRVPADVYTKQARGGKGRGAGSVHDDDFTEQLFIAATHDNLMFVTSFGNIYQLNVYDIPEGNRTTKGRAVINLLDIKPGENITSIFSVPDYEGSILFYTKKGIIKRSKLSEYANTNRNGIIALNVASDDTVVGAVIIDEYTQWVSLVTRNAMSIRFPVGQIRDIGRTARGVVGIKLKPDDEVCGGITIENEEQEILLLGSKGIGKRTYVQEYREQSRGGKGIIAMKLTKKTGNVVGMVLVEEDKDLMCLTAKGKMLRVDVQNISKIGRNASGVIIGKTESDNPFVGIAKCPKETDED